ncbi:hypothetical protein [Flavobacterium sp.]|uniref:hypothetical protein n=1 Tax=Flavobacterium sp. TaxID=239 RepID=UPI003266C9E8
MKVKRFLWSLLLINFSIVAQNKKITAVVADSLSKLPLEKVNIYNEKDNSLTNEEGAFTFVSEVDVVNFSLIGYESIQLKFNEIKNQDTIFMKIKSIELDEVVVGNETAILKKAYSKIKDNYALEPYNEIFFLRCILKRDSEITRLQDIYAKISRKSLFKTSKQPDNKCEIEILNMRKIGISEKKNVEYFRFHSFEKMFDLFTMLNITIEKFELTEEKNTTEGYIKISFITKDDSSIGQKTSGYFIINKEDYAFVETYFDFYNNIEKIPYTEDGKIKYRTTAYNRTTNFKRNNATGKYYLNNANSDFRVEVVGKDNNNKAFYDCSTVFFVTNSFITDKADSNISMDKDVFKVKYPFSDQFWKSQNQLPLTTDLKDFLKRVTENKDNKKEFEEIGNF